MKYLKYLFILAFLIPSLAWSQQPMGGDTVNLRGLNLRLLEQSAPGTPTAGHVIVYPKSDHKIYKKDSTGAESEIGTGGSSYTFRYSLVGSGVNVNLVNDAAAPGNIKYYGTTTDGTRGFYGIPNTHGFQWVVPGTLTTGLKDVPRTAPWAMTLVKAYAVVGTAPTTSSILIDIHKNETTIWSTQDNRLAIAATATTGTQTSFNTTTFAENDVLTFYIDQIGSGTAGADLSVILTVTTDAGVTGGGGGTMVYPGAGIGVSTGSAWGTSLADPVTITHGGTGATSAGTARTALGVAALGANSDITSLSALSTPLSVPQGGTTKAAWTQYAIPYASTTTALGEIPIGTANYYLRVNSGGTGYTFSAGTGTTDPGGLDTQIQFNYGGAFGGSNNLTWDYTNNILGVTGRLKFPDENTGYISYLSDAIRARSLGITKTTSAYHSGSQESPIAIIYTPYGSGNTSGTSGSPTSADIGLNIRNAKLNWNSANAKEGELNGALFLVRNGGYTSDTAGLLMNVMYNDLSGGTQVGWAGQYEGSTYWTTDGEVTTPYQVNIQFGVLYNDTNLHYPQGIGAYLNAAKGSLLRGLFINSSGANDYWKAGIYLAGKYDYGIDLSSITSSTGTIRLPQDGKILIGLEGSYLSRQTSDGSTVLQTAQGDLLLNPNGAYVSYGTYVATPGTITGYIYIKDTGGNLRKLAVTN